MCRMEHESTAYHLFCEAVMQFLGGSVAGEASVLQLAHHEAIIRDLEQVRHLL